MNDRSSKNGATRHVDYSFIQEVGLDRDMTRGVLLEKRAWFWKRENCWKDSEIW